MVYKIKWKKSFFSNITYIYKDNRLIGKLVNKMFSKAKVELNNSKYIIDGLPYSRNYEITDLKTREIVGEIDTYKSKKSIKISNFIIKESFEYEGGWLSNSWKIITTNNNMLLSTGSYNKGEIMSEFDDEIAILSGVFLNSFYWQYNVFVLLIILFVLILSFLNK